MEGDLIESRLVLGTAQLGMAYGIGNREGKPELQKAASIISEAWDGGVREFDTAQGYGESEHVLGTVLRSAGKLGQAKITSKFSGHMDHDDPNALKVALEKSLEKIGINHLYGMLLHGEHYLDYWDDGLGDALMMLVDNGLVEHIGVSVYSPEKALLAIEKKGIHIIQIPSNFLDRRFRDAGIFEEAVKKQKTIYVRSIFLQGLLLMQSESLPEYMNFAGPVLEKVESFSKSEKITRLELALGYARKAYPKAKIIFGAETPEQVRTNLLGWGYGISDDCMVKIEHRFSHVEEKVLNPILWKN